MKFSERSLMRMEGVDEKLQDVMHMALQLTKIDFGIPPYGGIRTAEEQNLLWKEGKSLATGYGNKKSKHQSGNAIDIYAYVDGRASWEEEHLAKVACAVLQAANRLGYEVDWGGLWKFNDMPHFQLR